jgi:hypothetical protein
VDGLMFVTGPLNNRRSPRCAHRPADLEIHTAPARHRQPLHRDDQPRLRDSRPIACFMATLDTASVSLDAKPDR